MLVHCTAAGRAGHLWAAYLVSFKGFSVSEAYGRGVTVGIGVTPFAKMIDRQLKMVEAVP